MVYCKDCKYLMFSDCYGECAKGIRGIVRPDDTCEYGVRKSVCQRCGKNVGNEDKYMVMVCNISAHKDVFLETRIVCEQCATTINEVISDGAIV